MARIPGAHRAGDVPAAIKAPATNLTIGSACVGLVAFVITFWDRAFEAVFGADASDETRRWIMLGIIAAFALIAAADLVSRGLAASARDSGWGQVASAVESETGVEGVFPVQRTTETSDDDAEFVAVAKRTRSGRSQLLLVKADAEPAWVDADEVSFDGDA